MSITLGKGTTSEKQARWVMLGILLVILIANRAFSCTTKPTSQPRQPKTPVTQNHFCKVTREGVPVCVTVGVFPTNPAWTKIMEGK